MSPRLAGAVLGGFLLLAPGFAEQGAAWAQVKPAVAVVVKVGATTSLPGVDADRVAVVDPDVADIRLVGKGKVELTGRSAGDTEVVVWRKSGERVSYRVTVSR